jgi:hypothetical protein
MVAIPGTRFNTASGLDTTFGSEGLALAQVEDLAQTANHINDIPGAATAASQTLTAAQLINGLLRVTGAFGGAGTTWTTPTAAQIVAAIPNAQVGSSFDFFLANTSGQTQTMAAGTGVTVVGTSLLAITTAHNGFWKFTVTNATLGAEAVNMYPVSVAVL